MDQYASAGRRFEGCFMRTIGPGQNGRGRNRRFSISAGTSCVIQIALISGYSLLTIASLEAAGREPAKWMATVDRVLHPLVASIFSFVGKPTCRSGNRPLPLAYVQLLTLDLAVGLACFLACIPFWKDWARRLRAHPAWAGNPPQQVENKLQIGEGLTLVGAVGALWLLLAGDPTTTDAACSTLSPWPFLRTPLLTTVIYGLSCFAAAFGVARGHDPDTSG
jgi:hypothetical protein